MKPEIIIAAYERSRTRGLSVAQSIQALKMEGVPLGVLIEVYRQCLLDGTAEGGRLEERHGHRVKNTAWLQVGEG